MYLTVVPVHEDSFILLSRSVLVVLLSLGCLCTASEPTRVAAFKAPLHCEDPGVDRGGLIPALELLPRRQFSGLLHTTRSVPPQLYGHKITPLQALVDLCICVYACKWCDFRCNDLLVAPNCWFWLENLFVLVDLVVHFFIHGCRYEVASSD
jgi:hypothetical protein